ncbi:MAG TPA: acetyl-CoA carboxylase carboxyltransferase subunit alpha [Bacteroidetes bacterium]|nr:acetyl-coenzyme A carboxylase carboxyl transferase subunit alpha [bacterium BMS3Bbin04]HDO64808.1 acetyl-CoA carboxylase carboxyltransferase subunit alpha [Bacteroidota bacterium]HEX03933.1 acetyl-CoA carboxylase carboxyltransferase subunit alpha [Bacteroidota bacterium]
MREFILDFEKPVIELEKKIAEMQDLSSDGVDLSEEVALLQKKADGLRADVFNNLNRWQRVQLARHPRRPYTLDYLKLITSRFEEIHGDRNFRDDQAIITGMATIDGLDVMIVGHQKGRGTKDKLYRNFGMPHPEGYRKALRAMKVAEKFNRPILTLIDTPGAYPGLGAEERGQAEAIARNLYEMSQLRVPLVACVIGEGGSGGALAIGVTDRVLMLEHAIYSVISPEGCASILWRDAAHAPSAADAMKITSPDLLELGIIDEVVPEAFGGAHRDWKSTAQNIKTAVLKNFKEVMRRPTDEMIDLRVAKFGSMGVFEE